MQVALDGAFDEDHLANTFRLVLSLQQLDSNNIGAQWNRVDYKISEPFNVIIVPVFLQTHFIPYTIVYAPPGNQSTIAFTTTDAFTTVYTAGNSAQIANRSQQTASESVQQSITEGEKARYGSIELGGSATQGSSSSWDYTTSNGVATTDGSGSVATSSISLSSTWSIPNNKFLIPGTGGAFLGLAAYYNEPFWSDVFVLIAHPQFATWVLQPAEKGRFVATAAVPATVDITVGQLASCASGVQIPGSDTCVITYQYSYQLTDPNGQPANATNKAKSRLSAREAQNLLALDPFYIAGQGAVVDDRRATSLFSRAYGMKAKTALQVGAELPISLTETYVNTKIQEFDANDRLEYTSNVTSVLSTSQSIGGNVDFGFYLWSLGLGNTNSSTSTMVDETDLKIVFTDSTAATTRNLTSAVVTLNDIDNTLVGPDGGILCGTCHAPLADLPAATILFDKQFGSFMFQDFGAPGRPLIVDHSSIALTAIRVMAQQEQAITRFIDVPGNSEAKAAIGFMIKQNIMTGYADGTFRPDIPLVRGDLATMLTNALHLPTGDSTVKSRARCVRGGEGWRGGGPLSYPVWPQ
jgi:S-layer homology domain